MIMIFDFFPYYTLLLC